MSRWRFYSAVGSEPLSVKFCIPCRLKKAGKFVATQRTEGVSTSDVITRIISKYDTYVRRNLARGYSRQDLNLSYMREKRIKIKAKMDALEGKCWLLTGHVVPWSAGFHGESWLENCLSEEEEPI